MFTQLNFIVINACFISLLSCSSINNKPVTTQKQANYQELKTTRIKFNFNQVFAIKEIKKGSSISDIYISGIGFQNSSAMLKFKSSDPIENYLVADIDADGFEELYLITRSVGSGSYGKIVGVSSNKGKSYKSIYIPEYDKSLNLKLDYLEGYMGNDFIYVKDKHLWREFPVYKSTDTNNNATGGICKIVYALVEYNNSFSLQVQSFQTICE